MAFSIQKKVLGSLISTMRAKRKLTMGQLAEVSDLAPATISSLEGAKYKRSPLLSTAMKAARAMGYPTSQLLQDYEKATNDLRGLRFQEGAGTTRAKVQDAIVQRRVDEVMRRRNRSRE